MNAKHTSEMNGTFAEVLENGLSGPPCLHPPARGVRLRLPRFLSPVRRTGALSCWPSDVLHLNHGKCCLAWFSFSNKARIFCFVLFYFFLLDMRLLKMSSS